MAEERELSYGEKLVGISFNPSGSNWVDTLKVGYAAQIDKLNDIRTSSKSPEQEHFAQLAIDQTVAAQMMAVKAATWGL